VKKDCEGVWQAVYDHYLLSTSTIAPRGLAGAAVSLARPHRHARLLPCRLKPTGSKDRSRARAAQGVVQILLNRDKRQVKIGIDKLLDLAVHRRGQERPAAFFADA